MNYSAYINKITASLAGIEKQSDNIDAAASAISRAANSGRLIHIIGTEQVSSALIADVFFQPGSPITLDPMVDPTFDIAHGAYRNAMCLDIQNLVPCIMDYYEYVDQEDPIVIIGSDPSLRGFSDAVNWSKNKGLKIITVSCSEPSGAGISLVTGKDSLTDGSYTALASTILQLVFKKANEEIDSSNVWKGNRFVDFVAEREKIDKVLFRVRHL